MITDLGRVIPVLRGAYNALETYSKLDIVTYAGSSFICKQESTGHPTSDATYWQLLAQGTGNPLAFYPVGALYFSTVSTNPGDIFGGTWAAFGSGKAIVGVDPSDPDFDKAGVAVGSKTASGTLSASAKIGISSTSIWAKRKTFSWQADGKAALAGAVANNTDNLTSAIEVEGNTTVSTVQPSIPVYIFQRTA